MERGCLGLFFPRIFKPNQIHILVKIPKLPTESFGYPNPTPANNNLSAPPSTSPPPLAFSEKCLYSLLVVVMHAVWPSRIDILVHVSNGFFFNFQMWTTVGFDEMPWLYYRMRHYEYIDEISKTTYLRPSPISIHLYRWHCLSNKRIPFEHVCIAIHLWRNNSAKREVHPAW